MGIRGKAGLTSLSGAAILAKGTLEYLYVKGGTMYTRLKFVFFLSLIATLSACGGGGGGDSPSSGGITTTTTVPAVLSEPIDRTASQWMVTTTTSSVDGVKTTELLATGGGRFNFRIYCTSDGKKGYYAITDFVTGSGYFKYRIGHNPVVSQYWTESPAAGYSRLYPASFDMTLLAKMYQNWNFAVQLDRFNVGIIEDANNLTGMPATIDKTRDACGWSTDLFPPNNGWGNNPYPDVPPPDAIEATYVPGAPQQFGLIAWRATNPSNKKQLMVRVGQNKSLCLGGFLITDNRLYVEQDGKRVTATSGIDLKLSCPNQKPVTLALQGDFDASRPFVLRAYPFHTSSLAPGEPISSVILN